jgi:SAM-dependent methyltransferase
MPARDDIYSEAGARYYDAASAVLRGSSGDVDFYRSLSRDTGGPVLELGCGSGRVLLPIAREGVACVGLDASEAMLRLLAARDPPANLRAVHGRMENFELPGERFSLIFSAFRAFQHLLTVEEELSCLDRVRKHLAPGGLFALDVFAPKLERVARTEEPEFEEARFAVGPTEVVRFATVRRDLAHQTMEVTYRYEQRAGNVAALETRIATTRMRWIYRYELEHLLARAGFAWVEVSGGFDRRPYDYYSGETVVTAKADS